MNILAQNKYNPLINDLIERFQPLFPGRSFSATEEDEDCIFVIYCTDENHIFEPFLKFISLNASTFGGDFNFSPTLRLAKRNSDQKLLVLCRTIITIVSAQHKLPVNNGWTGSFTPRVALYKFEQKHNKNGGVFVSEKIISLYEQLDSIQGLDYEILQNGSFAQCEYCNFSFYLKTTFDADGFCFSFLKSNFNDKKAIIYRYPFSTRNIVKTFLDEQLVPYHLKSLFAN